MTPKRKLILFQISLFLGACVIIEIVLRIMGYAPGDLRPNWFYFRPVDSLYVIPDYTANAEGLRIADSNYWSEHNVHINTDGFRGKEFNGRDTTKKKILFIGDSFTWGLSAEPFYDSSFCDLLQGMGNYEVYNTGIPATDPPQYAAVANKYIPQLKPDFVFVMFYMGNDLMREDAPIIPGKQTCYWTNAGAISTEIDGIHFSNANDAYNYLANEKYYLKNPKGFTKKVIAQSALLSRLYAGKFRIEEKLSFERVRKNPAITNKYLHSILSTANANNIPVRFVLIPYITEADMKQDSYTNRYSTIIKDTMLDKYWLMPPVQGAYYNANPDGHLNNKGHGFYAQYLRDFLQGYFER